MQFGYDLSETGRLTLQFVAADEEEAEIFASFWNKLRMGAIPEVKPMETEDGSVQIFLAARSGLHSKEAEVESDVEEKQE